MRTRIYYCNECGKRSEFNGEENRICDCGHIYSGGWKPVHQVNMRTTWSGTTKIEFSNETMEQSIKDFNN